MDMLTVLAATQWRRRRPGEFGGFPSPMPPERASGVLLRLGAVALSCLALASLIDPAVLPHT